MNTRLHRLLREAQKEADQIIARATAEAERMRQVSSLDRQRMESDLDERAANERAIAIAEAHVLISSAKTSAERTVDDARRQAHRLVEDAERESGEIRGATATDAARLRASARHEAESMIATAERFVAELQLKFADDITTGRVVSLGREFAEQLKLDVELSVRRDEAEKDYLAKHNEAVLLTQKYLEEAEVQLKNLRVSIRESELTALAISARAEGDALDVVADVHSQVDAILETARSEATRVMEVAETRRASIIDNAQEQVAQLISQREAINSFVVSMNDEAEKIATREQKSRTGTRQT
jgi:vacuolar-type H+-ATPase subunit H